MLNLVHHRNTIILYRNDSTQTFPRCLLDLPLLGDTRCSFLPKKKLALGTTLGFTDIRS